MADTLGSGVSGRAGEPARRRRATLCERRGRLRDERFLYAQVLAADGQ